MYFPFVCIPGWIKKSAATAPSVAAAFVIVLIMISGLTPSIQSNLRAVCTCKAPRSSPPTRHVSARSKARLSYRQWGQQPGNRHRHVMASSTTMKESQATLDESGCGAGFYRGRRWLVLESVRWGTDDLGYQDGRSMDVLMQTVTLEV